MRVHRLVEILPPDGKFEYQGNVDAYFRGFSGGTGRDTQGRFYCPDPATIQRAYGEEDAPMEAATEAAFRSGATGVVCTPVLKGAPYLEGRNVFFTDTPVRFRAQVAAAIRGILRRSRIVAVTGSAGKSTTKAMIAHALRAAKPKSRVHALATNQNRTSHVVAQVSRSHNHHYTVIEASSGIFQFLDQMSFTISPDVAIVTNIAEAHLEQHGDLEGVARAKSGIFNKPPSGGVAVINLDTAHSDLLVIRAREEGARVVTYGEDSGADISLLHYDAGRGEVTTEVDGERVQYSLGAGGRHMALNSLAVLATLRALNIDEWRSGLDSLASFGALSGRGRVEALGLSQQGSVTLVDDAYNANPASMRSALAMLSEMVPTGSGSRVAILGDMLELGENAPELHSALADAVLQSRAEKVHLFGELMGALYGELEGRVDVRHWSGVEELTEALRCEVVAGDVLLVKSSQGAGLHSVVKSLKAAYPPPA